MEECKTRPANQLRERILYALIILVSVLLLYAGRQFAVRDLVPIHEDDYGEIIVKCRVTEILDRVSETYYLDSNTSVENIRVIFRATVVSGRWKGEAITGAQTLDGMYSMGVKEVRLGDKVLLAHYEGQVEEEWIMLDYARADKLIIFAALFILALLGFGRWKGVNTILSLLFTCAAIFLVFIPAILSGKNIYLCAIAVCVYVIAMTYLIVNGFNKKTLAATLGCFGGLALAGVLTLLMDKILGLTGYVDEDSIYLSLMSTTTPINLNAVIFAAVLIGAMGAVMDVSMSISSSLWEVMEKSKERSFKSLFRSGVNIGRDIMGTMANTLILAYIGGSLSVVLLLSAYTTSLLYLLNREMIVVEILQALIGSFGILLALPLTSLISALIFTKTEPDKAGRIPGGQETGGQETGGQETGGQETAAGDSEPCPNA
jgi:uncharacterized membrane protein